MTLSIPLSFMTLIKREERIKTLIGYKENATYYINNDVNKGMLP